MGKVRIEYESGLRVRIELIEDRPAEGRFAGADFAGYLYKTLSFPDAVYEVGDRFLVYTAQKKEIGMKRLISLTVL